MGLPYNFAFTSEEDIRHTRIKFGAEETGFDWDSVAGRKLKETLVLSENAKRFAIAQKINEGNTFRIHIGLIGISTSLILGFIMGDKLIWKLLRQRHWLIRLYARVFTLALGFLGYILLRDACQYYWDFAVSSFLATPCKLNLAYATFDDALQTHLLINLKGQIENSIDRICDVNLLIEIAF